MSTFMQKAKAIAIHGPPVIFDGTTYLIDFARLKLLPTPKLADLKLPKTIVTFKDGSITYSIKQSNFSNSKLSPELAKSARDLSNALTRLIVSLSDYSASLRQFKASYHGVPLWEEPRI